MYVFGDVEKYGRCMCPAVEVISHSIILGHRILLNCNSILAKISRRMNKISEIELHTNMNKEDWFFLSRS
jgi:hypothetical protein